MLATKIGREKAVIMITVATIIIIGRGEKRRGEREVIMMMINAISPVVCVSETMCETKCTKCKLYHI